MTQQYVDSTYPPTMTFNVDSLKPTGVLKERAELIRKHFLTFFQGQELLDIGCSKGWFSISNAKAFNQITALDIDLKAIDVCRTLNKSENIQFQHTGFRGFISSLQFDKIFIGNTAHHLFMEIEGWEWISKLAALSCGSVLIEGAISTNCKDMKRYIPDNLHRNFNRFLEMMKQHFFFIEQVPTVSYTPDRYLMLFRKKCLPQFELSDLPCLKVFREMDFKTYLTKTGFFKKAVAKVCIVSQPIWRDMNRIRIAACSPISNGMIGEIYDGGECVGWLEPYNKSRTYRYFQNEKNLFRRICIHNIFLSKLGYVDLDSATINFFKGSNLMFDKSCVFPIKHLKPKSINVFPILFKQSYKSIPERFGYQVAAAIKTGNSVRVEQIFREGMQKWT